MLPLRIVLDRNRGGSYLMFLLVGAGLFAMFLFLTYYFQINLGYSPLKAGFAFLPFSGGIILAAGVVSQLLPRVGPAAVDDPGLVDGHRRHAAADPDQRRTRPTSRIVLPAELLMSVGLAGVFIPAASTALLGRRAPRRRCRQRGAQQLAADRRLARHGAAQHACSPRAVTAYLADNLRSPADAAQQTPRAR